MELLLLYQKSVPEPVYNVRFHLNFHLIRLMLCKTLTVSYGHGTIGGELIVSLFLSTREAASLLSLAPSFPFLLYVMYMF
jgi:hypothetical protein